MVIEIISYATTFEAKIAVEILGHACIKKIGISNAKLKL